MTLLDKNKIINNREDIDIAYSFKNDKGDWNGKSIKFWWK
jgi:hypothetical protein